jgi:hypothetical protein
MTSEATNAPETVKMELNGTFTAPELEEIIHELAKRRSAMQPAVPLTREGAMHLGSAMLIEPSPRFVFATKADGGLRISLRNSGIGWLAFELSAADVDGIRKLISGELSELRTMH